MGREKYLGRQAGRQWVQGCGSWVLVYACLWLTLIHLLCIVFVAGSSLFFQDLDQSAQRWF